MHDLVIKGGRVIDPAQGIDGNTDLAFSEGRVSAMGANLSGQKIIDATDRIVTPGLIDLHTHVYWGGTSLGVDPVDYARQSAVTTAVDTGSAGPGNFAGFRKHVIEPCPVRILAYLHVSHAGIFGFSDTVHVGESEDIRLMDPIAAASVADANRDVVVGIKVRLGRHASGMQGMSPFEFAVQVADATGLPMMVHIDEPPPGYAEVVERLRPGDVLTHCFRPFPNTPLIGDAIRPEVVAARDRGVIFDIGHGMGSFSYDVARRMLAAGFAPDTISSDVHALCINGPAFDLITTMNKFLSLGMSLPEIVTATTTAPARAVNRPDLGTLKIGSVGDASILRMGPGTGVLTDATGQDLQPTTCLSVTSVVLNGAEFAPE